MSTEIMVRPWPDWPER